MSFKQHNAKYERTNMNFHVFITLKLDQKTL